MRCSSGSLLYSGLLHDSLCTVGLSINPSPNILALETHDIPSLQYLRSAHSLSISLYIATLPFTICFVTTMPPPKRPETPYVHWTAKWITCSTPSTSSNPKAIPRPMKPSSASHWRINRPFLSMTGTLCSAPSVARPSRLYPLTFRKSRNRNIPGSTSKFRVCSTRSLR